MAKMAQEGHRVVVVVATGGERGEVADGFLQDDETLTQRRAAELAAATEILGASRVVSLGYVDSGMMGTAANEDPASFWQADVETAAGRLAAVLREESADVLTVYDDHGNYGHPDHIQVHRVGHRAASLADVPRVYEATINRDHVRRRGSEVVDGPGAAVDDDFLETIGLPDDEITTAVDVIDQLALKRQAMLAHASQMAPDSWFFGENDEMFEAMWRFEWYRQATPTFDGDPVANRSGALL